MKRVWLVLAILFSWNSGRADNLFGDFKRVPDEIEQGFFIASDFGLLFLTGPQSNGNVNNPGFQLTFTSGYDITKYIAIEAICALGISEAHPINYSGGINSFLFDGAIKGQYPLIGRLHPFVEVGGGLHYSKPKILPTEGSNHLNILISGGMEYYTYLRHYSLYMKATYAYVQLPIDQISLALGIKYTF